jgi:hypothetical protein
MQKSTMKKLVIIQIALLVGLLVSKESTALKYIALTLLSISIFLNALHLLKKI